MLRDLHMLLRLFAETLLAYLKRHSADDAQLSIPITCPEALPVEIVSCTDSDGNSGRDAVQP